MQPLVRGIEPSRVSHHRHEAGAFRGFRDCLGILPAIGERDFHLHVLARFETQQGLRRMQGRRCREDRGLHAWLTQRLGEIRRGVRHAVFACNFLRGGEIAADDRHDFDAADLFDCIEMLDAERPDTRQYDLHDAPPGAGSRMRWPTAVFDAGT
jgi:hypothetical protein